jgi:Holliday junction resolvase RusA-like endonuclease
MSSDPAAAPARLSWDVVGLPKPKGSKRLLRPGGRPGAPVVAIESAGPSLRTWTETVAVSARAHRALLGRQLVGAVGCDLVFRFRMPRSRRAPIRRAGRSWATSHAHGDVDKLTRGVLDALVSGGLLYDDSQIALLSATKYEIADGWLGAEIDVYELPPIETVRERHPSGAEP